MRRRVYKKTAAVHVKAINRIVMATIFIAQTTTKAHVARSIPQYGTDSGLIGIDNRCSVCMSHVPADFLVTYMNEK